MQSAAVQRLSNLQSGWNPGAPIQRAHEMSVHESAVKCELKSVAHLVRSWLFYVLHGRATCGILEPLGRVLELPRHSNLLAIWGDHQQGLGREGVQGRIQYHLLLMQPRAERLHRSVHRSSLPLG